MMRNAPRIVPQPSNPFPAPLLLLDAVVAEDGVPGVALGAVVVGGGVLVPVAVVGSLNELLPAGVAVADPPLLPVPVLLNVDVSTNFVHAPR